MRCFVKIKIMNILKKNKKLVILAIIGIVFFLVYSYLPISQLSWKVQNNVENFDFKFNTPDEVVNYYFSQQYARTGNLYYMEPFFESGSFSALGIGNYKHCYPRKFYGD